MIDVGTITSSDVPFATRSPAPNPVIRRGTRMTPPPMPNRPDATPMKSPAATRASPMRRSTSTSAPRSGAIRNMRMATRTSRAMKSQRSQTIGIRFRSLAPRNAPVTPPMATSSATTRSTSPFAK
jgi:hypothetical protein